MGVNQQTSVPAFTSGQVLTAQQQTEINTGVPVFADSTARDAAFGGTGEKVLAEGQLAYLESTNVVQYYDGSNWATVGPAATGGLTKISTNTLSASSTCIFTSLAVGTYRIQGALNASTTATILARFREGGTDKATGYAGGYYGRIAANAISGITGTTSILIDATGNQAANKQSFFSFDFYIYSAGTAAFINGQSNGADTANADSPRFIGFGAHNISMSACDGINILLSSGTMTGQVTIYSYA
jgi:hypothetical protein